MSQCNNLMDWIFIVGLFINAFYIGNRTALEQEKWNERKKNKGRRND